MLRLKKPKKKRVYLEDSEQIKLVQWANLYPNLIGKHLISIENEKRCSLAAGVRAKLRGKKAGVTDLLLLRMSQGYGGFFIEMKRPKTANRPAGTLSQAQKDFIKQVTEEGYKAEAHWSWVTAANAIIDYLQLDLKL
jgi:hypothetical protein